MNEHHFDIAIIGSGPGGYVAAIRAAQLGFKTVCIDQYSSLGGTCLNVGCIPSKTLLQGTELYSHLQHRGQEFGIQYSNLSFDFAKLMKRKQEVVKSLTEGIEGLFRQHQITFLQGKAEFLDPHRLRVTSKTGTSQEIEANYILIATGAQPIALPNIPFEGRQIVSSTGALSLPKIPERLVIIGAGVIGVELASVYQRLGSQVTILEMLDRICPSLDESLSQNLLKILNKQGIEFYLNSEVVTAVVQPDEIILTAKIGDKLRNLSASVVLVAVGRRPFTDDLQLEKVGIKKDQKGFIEVDQNFRTQQPHIFAIGDVIKGTMLAHRASTEGVAVIEFLKDMHPEVHYECIPNVIYTDPEVACVGLTEQEAKSAGLDIVVGKSFFRANGRARCSGDTEGFVKIIGEKRSGRLLGMHILGAHASELIAEGMLAMQKKASLKDLADAPQAHPTLSETIKEAAFNAINASSINKN